MMEEVIQQNLEEVISAVMSIPDDVFSEIIMEQKEMIENASVVSPHEVREAIKKSGISVEEYRIRLQEEINKHRAYARELPVSKEKREFIEELLTGMAIDTLYSIDNHLYIEELVVPVEIGEGAEKPQRNTELDACDDLFVTETVTIPAFSKALVGTGLKMAIPVGFEGQVRLRSGVSAKTPLLLANGVGTIDSGYQGEVKLSLANLSPDPYTVEAGTRIAQIKISPIFRVKWNPVDDISSLSEDRGGGFGSSGSGVFTEV